MKKRVVKIQLNEAGVDQMIKELEDYKKWLTTKTKEFLQALADAGIEIAEAKFKTAKYAGTNDVEVSIEERGETSIAIVATGGSVLFIEFGTGIKYPDNHPDKPAGILGHGEYGYKLGGLDDGWRYTGDPGNMGKIIQEGKHIGEVHTYGNPANMSMYLTVQELKEKFEEIARRVYV